VDRPYVLLSCAMSLDGYIDDTSDQPLRLSGDADVDRVDELRARSDAILVGAGTVRADDPVLLVRSPARRSERIASGRNPDPARVVISGTGNLDPAAQIFTTGSNRIVYVSSAAVAATMNRLGSKADIADAGHRVDLGRVLDDLAVRGVARLMVEGGASVLTQFLRAGLADELVLAVAPFFIGDPRAPRLVEMGQFPWTPRHRARLADVSVAGDMAVLRYALSSRCRVRLSAILGTRIDPPKGFGNGLEDVGRTGRSVVSGDPSGDPVQERGSRRAGPDGQHTLREQRPGQTGQDVA
jgi:5-amino-6-(5-phosphoribosylamino)uracil reductase